MCSRRKKPVPPSCRAGSSKEMTFEFRFDRGQGRLVQGCEQHAGLGTVGDAGERQRRGRRPVSRDRMTQSLEYDQWGATVSAGCPEGCPLGARAPFQPLVHPLPPFCPRVPTGKGYVLGSSQLGPGAMRLLKVAEALPLTSPRFPSGSRERSGEGLQRILDFQCGE